MFDSNQSLSGSSNPSACYDAKKSCIRLLEEGSLLEGSIIEMEQPEQSGTFLLGEVMEIVIMGDGLVPLAVHNERVKKAAQSPTYIVNANTLPKKYVYDEHRRAEIQSLMKDKSIEREEKLRRMAEIKTKYEILHSQTSTEIHSPTVNAAPEPQTPQQLSSPTRAVDRWNRGAVAAVSANALKQSITKPKPDSQPELSDNSASRASNRWNKAAVAAVSTNTVRQSITTKKSFEQPKNINEEDVDDLIRLLRFNDPSLTSLILDGRGFDEASWEALFGSVEENTYVKELSLVNCNLDDSTVGTLVLALVENETLISINLSCNEDLTDDTGDMLRKVLRQGNAFVKKIIIEGTNISTETADKIQTILDERDDSVKLQKLQEARQAKIKALLAFSASSEVERNNRRLSNEEDEAEDDDSHTLLKRRLSTSVSSTISQKSGDSASKRTGKQSKASRRRSVEFSSNSRSSSQLSNFSGGNRPSPENKLQKAVKANIAARQMANLGGEMNDIGKSASQLKELRQQRGECVHCGQKCFKKTMFKAIPLSIPNKVHEGRCLRCVQFR